MTVQILMTKTSITLPTTPRRPREGMGRGFMLALAAHAVLLVGLTIGVNWQTQEPESGAQAELWSQVPQTAAPSMVKPAVVPPTPLPEPITNHTQANTCG
jgi:colicin import membrane protein